MHPTVRLVTLAPGHFHAALIHKEMLPGVEPRAHVYAPLDADLLAHLDHIRRFNARPDRPTAWTVDVHAGPDFLDRFRTDEAGNTVVIAGRNKPKIDLILAAVRAGCHVLADKPWVIDPADLPKLDEVFHEADRHGVLAWDIMTERHEVTTRLQRALMLDPDVLGEPIPGTAEVPALELASVHYLAKTVAGAPLVRPAWWFAPSVAGTGPADVGTHLADLAMWLLFPDRAIDARAEIELLARETWTTPVSIEDFQAITGERQAVRPPMLSPSEALRPAARHLDYQGNGSVTYRLRDRVVRWTVRWEVGPDPVGDTHFAVARGSRADVIVRHDRAFGPGPQVFVKPKSPADAGAFSAVGRIVGGWGGTVTRIGDELYVGIPTASRTGHEAHFAEVLKEFVGYLANLDSVPAWERPNLLAKYAVTTGGGLTGRPLAA